MSILDGALSLLPFLELFFFSFLARCYRLVSRCDLTDGRPWNLWRSALLAKEKSRRHEIIDGAAFEDISWEYVAAITRNIDSN